MFMTIRLSNRLLNIELPFMIFRGTKLATSSGDTTVKIWDFSKAECVHTFTDHTHAGEILETYIRFLLYRY